MVRALTKIVTDCPRRQSALKQQSRETLGERQREMDSSFFLAEESVMFLPHTACCVQFWCPLFLDWGAGLESF